MKTIYRNNVIAALRKVVGYSVPKHLYHETTIDDLQAIRSEGLVPRVGDIVQTLDSYDEETNLDATFLSDEENELGGYVIWKVANKLGYSDWSKVTWDDIEEHGLLAIVDIDKHDGDEPVYKYLDDGKVINLDGEEVEYIETMEREMYADDCCSSPIEQGNWFSYVGVVPDRYITGKELVNYIKKVSTNHHVKNLMTKTEAALRAVASPSYYHVGDSKDLGRLSKKGTWKAFDGKDIPAPFWVSPSLEFAKRGLSKDKHLYKVKVNIPSSKIFGDKDLIDTNLGSSWHKMAVNEGRLLYEALENGDLFESSDNWESIFASIVGEEYDVIETKEFVDWAKSQGFKAVHVSEGQGDFSNVMLFDPSDAEIVEEITTAALRAVTAAPNLGDFINRATPILEVLGTPKGSYYACSETVTVLLPILTELGFNPKVAEATVAYPEDAPYAEESEAGHYFITIGNTILDFTLRQFIPDSAFPFQGSKSNPPDFYKDIKWDVGDPGGNSCQWEADIEIELRTKFELSGVIAALRSVVASTFEESLRSAKDLYFSYHFAKSL